MYTIWPALASLRPFKNCVDVIEFPRKPRPKRNGLIKTFQITVSRILASINLRRGLGDRILFGAFLSKMRQKIAAGYEESERAPRTQTIEIYRRMYYVKGKTNHWYTFTSYTHKEHRTAGTHSRKQPKYQHWHRLEHNRVKLITGQQPFFTDEPHTLEKTNLRKPQTTKKKSKKKSNDQIFIRSRFDSTLGEIRRNLDRRHLQKLRRSGFQSNENFHKFRFEDRIELLGRWRETSANSVVSGKLASPTGAPTRHVIVAAARSVVNVEKFLIFIKHRRWKPVRLRRRATHPYPVIVRLAKKLRRGQRGDTTAVARHGAFLRTNHMLGKAVRRTVPRHAALFIRSIG